MSAKCHLEEKYEKGKRQNGAKCERLRMREQIKEE
jgi:hypothetical protein